MPNLKFKSWTVSIKGDSHAKAKDLYEELLKETDISANLKADVYRQLGWMFHRFVTFLS